MDSLGKLKVVAFPNPCLQDVPQMLEHNAALMRAKENPTPKRLLMVAQYRDGEIGVFGLGEEEAGGLATCIGLLHLGIARLTGIYDKQMGNIDDVV